MVFGDSSCDEAFAIVCPYKGCFLTKTGSLIGAIRLSGIDPDAMTTADHMRAAVVCANIYGAQPIEISVSQFYMHVENQRITLRDRAHPVSHRLSKAREAAINERGVAATHLVHFFEYRDPTDANAGFLKTLASNLFVAPFDEKARALLRARFSAPAALLVREAELDQRVAALRRALEAAASKWSQIMDETEILSTRETWRYLKYVATQNETYLDPARPIEVPNDDCASYLVNGDITPVAYDNIDMLKLEGARPKYLRALTVTRAPRNPLGMWSPSFDAPIHARGNYTIMTHFSPYTAFERAILFREARNKLERGRLDFKKLLMADQVGEDDPNKESFALKRKRTELDQAEAIEDRWGTTFISVLMSGDDPAEVVRRSSAMETALTTAKMEIVFEGAGLPRAYQSTQPGAQHESQRRKASTLSRTATVSLLSKSTIGTPAVEDLDGEEAVYVFDTEDGVPFHYTPFVGGKAFAIGIGPTRSGKTFFKNTISTHFLKYGGFLRELDIDMGSETIARFFGDDGGVIRMAPTAAEGMTGLNPFSSAAGEGDLGFVSHMVMLCQAFLEANQNLDMQRLDQHEQRALDEAIKATLRLPRHLQSIQHMVNHLPEETQAKFARWTAGGIYDGLFNAEEDGIGDLTKRVGVVNLQAYRDNADVLRPLFMDLFFRNTRLFEDRRYLHLPKQMDVDEAHHPLKFKAFREFLLSKIQTWAKFFASITMWSQSPGHFEKIDGWEAIRSAASTFIFMADGQMDRGVYQRAFPLTDGMLNVIEKLEPRKDAFIIQPERGIAKKVRLRVEPEQIVINTSKPRETDLRERLIREHGFDKGFAMAVEQLTRHQPKTEDEEETV